MPAKAFSNTFRSDCEIEDFDQLSLSSPTESKQNTRCLAKLSTSQPCWPVSGLAETTSVAFPSACSRRPVACVTEAESITTRPLDRCGGSAGEHFASTKHLLLPVELRNVNHVASTNAIILAVKK